MNVIEVSATFLHVTASIQEHLRKRQERKHPLLLLEEDDLDFVVQFVLASGSLKEMAHFYGVSYPTIRASLDRVIANLRESLKGEPPDAMTNLLADLIERGEIKASTARSIRAVYRSTLGNTKNKGVCDDREFG